MAAERNDRQDDDPELSRALRERLPRHPASAHLRAAVERVLEPAPRPWWRTAWLGPAVSALATAAVLVLWLVPSLTVSPLADPVQMLARAVVTEHARTLSWGQSQPEVVPAALPRVMEESGIVLNWVFTGDDDIQLVSAQPTYVEGHRGLSLGYMDSDGHAVTYVIAPAGNFTLPEAGRVRIDRWRPLVKRENGFSVILWTQQGLLCALVSDLVSEDDLSRLKEYFVKVRSSTEPAPVF